MDLTSLEILRVVAAERSVTRAAKALGRAPSNITTRVQQLEQHLGAALFSRDGKKMTLTQQGETFLTYANRLLALAQEAREAVKPVEPGGCLRVGTMESTAASRLPKVLSWFHTRWPTVSIKLTMGATRELIDDVVEERLDCAFVARPPGAIPRAGKLKAERVFTEQLLILMPRDHPEIDDAAGLQVDTLVALEPGCTYRRVAEAWVGKSAKVQTIEVGSYHAILASVSAGGAVGIIPRSVFEIMPSTSSFKLHVLGDVETLLIRRRDHRPPAFDAFWDVLMAASGTNRIPS